MCFRFRFIIATGLIFLLIQSDLSQSTPTSVVRVKITNQLGEIVVNASVTLVNLKQKKRDNHLSERGEAHFLNLRSGEYQLLIKASGFKNYEAKIFLAEDEIKTISVVLEVASVEETVDVPGDDEADASRFGTTRVLSADQLKNLPNDARLLEQVLQNMAGQTVTGEDMPITVNGFTGRTPPKQAIQQVRFNQNIFSAQYAESSGGGIEIFTKTDVDKIRGIFSFNLADSRFNATDAFLGKRDPYQVRGYNLYLFGPLLKKRSTYSMSAYHNDLKTNSIVNAVILNSSFQPTDYKQFFPSPASSDEIQLSVSADPTDRQRIFFAYEFSNVRAKSQGINEFALASRAYDSTEQRNSIRFAHTFLPNANTVNELQFQWDRSEARKAGNNNDNVAINVLDSFSAGGSQIDNDDTKASFELRNNTSWTKGSYALSFGVQLRGQKLAKTSFSDYGGTYVFSGRIAPILDSNNAVVHDINGNIVMGQITSLESYRRTLYFRSIGLSNQQVRELGGGGSQFTISGGNPTVSVRQFDIGAYLQNSYKFNKSTVITFGLRYENQTNIYSRYDFAPRLGFIWSPKTNKDKKLLFSLPKISVGFGVFYQRFGIANTAEIRGIADSDKMQFLITDESILDSFPNVPSINSLNQFALSKTLKKLSSEFRTPFQTLYSLNVVKKFSRNISANLTLSYNKSLRQPVVRNINAPLAGTFNTLNPTVAIYPLGRAGNSYEIISNGYQEGLRFNTTVNFLKTKRFDVYVSYYQILFSKNNITNGSGSPYDPYDFSNEIGPSSASDKRLTFYPSIRLPRGIELFANFSVSSGNRFNITTGIDTNRDGFFNERPSFARDLTKKGVIITKFGALDPNPSPNDKTIPRNVGVGPPSFNSSAFLSKTFEVGKKNPQEISKYNLSLSISVNNLFNIVNKANPIGNMSSPNFLQSVSGSINSVRNYIGGTQSNFTPGRSFFVTLGYQF